MTHPKRRRRGARECPRTRTGALAGPAGFNPVITPELLTEPPRPRGIHPPNLRVEPTKPGGQKRAGFFSKSNFSLSIDPNDPGLESRPLEVRPEDLACVVLGVQDALLPCRRTVPVNA
ncbi:hypothetical protein FQA47_005232, partial [Oryzias melastigma]